MDLASFFISDVIVHEIPRKPPQGDPVPELELSEVVAPTDTPVRNFFRERIADTLRKHGHEVEVDETQTSPVPAWIRRFVAAEADLVEMSKDMAKHLYAQQTNVQPEGLLVVAGGTVQGERALAILKLQKEEGARVLRQEHEGQTTLNIQHLRELMLTQRTRVFKAAVFHTGPEDQILGLVSDEQMLDLAAFFLERFLGCRLARRPSVVTKDFQVTATRFINDQVSDDAQKLRYHNALQVELNSHKETIRPRDWIEEHVDQDHRQLFEDALREADLPLDTFPKDIARLKPASLSQTRALTARGLRLTAPTSVFEEVVETVVREEGDNVLMIKDRITSVR